MFTTPEQFAAANKASVDAMLTLANTALASAERIAALNLNTARSMLEDGVANAKAMLGAKDPQEFFSVQASLAPVSYTHLPRGHSRDFPRRHRHDCGGDC